MELALEWLESQRAVMYDADKVDWFLQYKWTGTSGNGTIYGEPRGEGDQNFWNYMNPAAADYYVSSVTGVLVDSDGSADGTFTDDVDGLPAE